jgi:hypothetical protein
MTAYSIAQGAPRMSEFDRCGKAATIARIPFDVCMKGGRDDG